MDKFKKKTHHEAGKHPQNNEKPSKADFSETVEPDVVDLKKDTKGSLEKEVLETQGTDAEVTQDQNPKDEAMKESATKTIEVDEGEMLFTRRKIKNLEDENKKLNNEVSAFKERLVRLSAEYENYRKRTTKEKEEIGTESAIGILKEILPVIDNLERALVTETDDLPGLKEGVQMTLDQFVTAMEKMGVEMIPTDNGFDPNFHDAVMHETDESKGPRVVSEVFLKGYKKDDKVVRHSVVKVAN